MQDGRRSLGHRMRCLGCRGSKRTKMTENIATFLQSLRTSRSVLKASNGSDLIGPQPWRGSLAYLHILYPAIGGDEIEALEQLYGRPFPEDIKSLYKLTNGLSLFETSLNIYGHVANFTRDPGTWNPFSPEISVQTFSSIYPDWDRQGYLPIGSLVLYSIRMYLLHDRDGGVAVIDEDSGQLSRRYVSLARAIQSLFAELAPFWNEDGHRKEPQKGLDILGAAMGSC
jgi:hypothetical protein